MSLIVVKIEKYSAHPNANKLGICEVSDGKQSWQVVCGARNARAGMLTILAQIGDTTPPGMKIEEAEIRGVKSFGMLCSAKDLGIAVEAGIVDLPPQTQLGTKFEQLPKEILSSTPWHTFQEVEALFLDSKIKRIYRQRFPYENLKTEWRVLSKTYFHQGEYRYRNFN